MTRKRPYKSKRERGWLRIENIYNHFEMTKLGISGSIFSMDKMKVDATVAWGTVGSGSLDWKEIYYSSEANSQKFQAKHGR